MSRRTSEFNLGNAGTFNGTVPIEGPAPPDARRVTARHSSARPLPELLTEYYRPFGRLHPAEFCLDAYAPLPQTD